MPTPETVAGAPKLLQLVRSAARVRHFSPRTEEAYVAWVRGKCGRFWVRWRSGGG